MINIPFGHWLGERHIPDFVVGTEDVKINNNLGIPVEMQVEGEEENVFRERFPLDDRKLKSHMEWQVDGPTENSFRRWNVLHLMEKYTAFPLYNWSWVQREEGR